MPLSISAASLKSRSRSSHGSTEKSENQPLIPTSQLWSLTLKQKVVIALAAGAQSVQFFAESAVPLLFPPESILKGLSHVQYGVVMAALGLTFGLAAPFQSALVPKIGLKSGFILVTATGGLGYVVFGLLHYVADSTAFAILALLTRLIQGVSFAAALVVEMGMMCLTLGDAAGVGFAIGTFTEGIGFALGPIVAGPLAQATNFMVPFVLAGIFMLMIGGASCCALESQPLSEDWTKFRLSDVRTLIKDGYVIISILLLGILAFAWLMVDVTLEQHLARYDYGVGKEGLMFGLGDAAYGLTAPLWGWLGGRHQKFGLQTMLISPFLAAVGNVFLGPIPGLSALDGYLAIDLAALVVVRIAMSMLAVGSSAVMLERADDVVGTVTGAHIFATRGFPVLTLINVVVLIVFGVISLLIVYWVIPSTSDTVSDDRNGSSSQADKVESHHSRRSLTKSPSLPVNSYGSL